MIKMKKMCIKGGNVGLRLLTAFLILFVLSGSAFAVTDWTWVVNASSGQIASGDNCRYIAYYKNDDLYIQTEDSWNALPGYANTNAGYTLGGSPAKGYCRTDSTYYPDPDPASADTYDIWISSIADAQAGHASGLVDDVPLGSPSYVPTGNSNSVPFALASAGYLAEPANFKAYSGNGRVLLKWDAVTGATGYKVYRGPVSGTGVGSGIYQRIADTGNTYFEDSGTNGTTYYYLVYAYDATRRGVHTNQIPGTPDATAAPVITPPLVPTSGVVGATIVINGSGFGGTQGTVLFNGVPATTFPAPGWGATGTTITVQVPSGASTGNVYVINASNNKVSNGVSFTVTVVGPPTAPTGFNGTALSTTSIQWTWADVGDETGYYVHSGSSGGSAVSSLLPVNTIQWDETTGLSPNTSYTRHINAVNANGNTDGSSASRYTLANNPSGLVVSGPTATSLNLSWTAGTGGNTRYRIDRAPDVSGAPGSWSTIVDWANNQTTTSYTNTGLTASTTYWYRVYGFNGDGIVTTGFTGPISGTTTAPSVGPVIKYEGEGGIMVTYPNPYNPLDEANPLKMLFDAGAADVPVDIYIFDPNTRIIWQTKDTQSSASRVATWEGETAWGEVAENGLYLIRVVKKGKSIARAKILVIKK